MNRRSVLSALAASLAWHACAASAAPTGPGLIMVDRAGCEYCAAFRREIAPGYSRHPIGRRLPLTIVPVQGPWPDGLALDRAPVVTPTFLLIDGGVEVARIEGYPGTDRFWPQLAALVAAQGARP